MNWGLRSKLSGPLGKLAHTSADRRRRKVHGKRVLVIGIYMTEKPNLASQIVGELASAQHQVAQQWVALGCGQHGVNAMRSCTVLRLQAPCPKFAIVNRVLQGVELQRDFDYLLVVDDDIELPPVFLDRFIGVQEQLGFALAQPARSLQSNADHPVTWERPGLLARQTRFVEIGPLFSVAAAAFPCLLPFDERFFMGWGLDLVWPKKLEQAGMTLGIVDAVAVHHRFRPVASTYSGEFARSKMAEELAGEEQVPLNATRTSLRNFYW